MFEATPKQGLSERGQPPLELEMRAVVTSLRTAGLDLMTSTTRKGPKSVREQAVPKGSPRIDLKDDFSLGLGEMFEELNLHVDGLTFLQISGT